MTDNETQMIDAPAARPPLGPGDDDPKSAPASVSGARAPLGPGDDDPRSPAQVGASSARAPLAPGESDGHNPDDAFDFLAPPPPGPGDTHVVRHLVRLPKQQSPPPTADTFEEE